MSLSPHAIQHNLSLIKAKIASAAERSGRVADQVRLIAVTKYVGAEEIRLLHAAGCRDFGESRPQALWEKADQLDDLDLRWHLIGNLQRNKVRRTIPHTSLVHSGDSVRLLETINTIAKENNSVCDVLLEINISGDQSKHGFQPTAIAAHLDAIAAMNSVKVKGLMAMAAREGGVEQARQDFVSLRQLRDQLQRDCPESVELSELSMGMSDDFEVAIEEGATMVRIGSALTKP